MKLGYVTLACPNWTLEELFNRGAEYGFEGLELGWLEGQFPSASVVRANLAKLRSLSKSSGCRLFAIGSYIQLAQQDDAARKQVVSEARELIEITGDLGAEFVRVFGGWSVGNPTEEWMIEVVSDGLNQLAEAAARANVKVALEAHDFFNSTVRVRKALDKVPSPQIVALWDLLHPCRVDETPATVWKNLGGRIGYIHVKDARRNGSSSGWEPVPLGAGQVPVKEAIGVLAANEFDGFLAIEWEKRNHPNLAEPEVALPAAIATVKEYLKEFV